MRRPAAFSAFVITETKAFCVAPLLSPPASRNATIGYRSDCAFSRFILGFFDWSLNNGQQMAQDLLYVPLPELLTLCIAVALASGVWAALRYTDLGKAMRAASEDAPVAAAFGVNEKLLALLLSGACAAFAAVAGVCLALSHTLAPGQIYAWIGVVFAAVMIGGLGNPLGPLVAGIVIGVSEALTAAFTAPSWAPLVSFSLLIALLLLRPEKI